jgi:hypothetical protein
MQENLCGNCVGGVEMSELTLHICMTFQSFHMRAFIFLFHCTLT